MLTQNEMLDIKINALFARVAKINVEVPAHLKTKRFDQKYLNELKGFVEGEEKKQKKPTKFVSWVKAKQGAFLPGGVKEWESSPQDTRDEAKNVLAGYIDGHQESVMASGTKEITVKTK